MGRSQDVWQISWCGDLFSSHRIVDLRASIQMVGGERPRIRQNEAWNVSATVSWQGEFGWSAWGRGGGGKEVILISFSEWWAYSHHSHHGQRRWQQWSATIRYGEGLVAFICHRDRKKREDRTQRQHQQDGKNPRQRRNRSTKENRKKDGFRSGKR